MVFARKVFELLVLLSHIIQLFALFELSGRSEVFVQSLNNYCLFGVQLKSNNDHILFDYIEIIY